MSFVHAHLILNHIPVIGVPLIALMLAIAWVRRSDELARVSIVVLLLIGAAGVGAMLTGDPASKEIRDLPDVTEAVVHAHEEFAEATTIAVGVAVAAVVAAL